MATGNFFAKLFNNRLFKAAVSGLLMGLCVTFPQLFLLSFAAMSLFFTCVLTAKTKRSVVFCFFVYAVCFYLTSYHWFLRLHPLDWLGIDGKISLLTAVVIWAAVSFLHSLAFAAMGALWSFIRQKNKLYSVLLLCFLYIIWEYLQQFSEYAFPWATLSLTQVFLLQNIQSANLFGGYFVSFIVLFANAFIALAALCKDRAKLFAALAAALILLNFSYGQIRLWLPKPKSVAVKIAAIQGNINPVDKWSDENGKSLDTYLQLTKNAKMSGADIVVWPETALPFDLELKSGNYYFDAISDIAAENGVYIIAGTFGYDGDGNSVNILTLFAPNGQTDGPYAKRSIVPLGEYIPKGILIDLLTNAFGGLNSNDDISRGKLALAFDAGGVKLSPLICFDSVFPAFARQSAKLGAQVLVVATNDAYYRNSANPRQHFSHAILRAVESNKPVVRAANTGISAVIDSLGRVKAKIPLGQQGFILEEVRLSQEKSFYHSSGELLVYVCCVGALFAAILKIISKLYNLSKI